MEVILELFYVPIFGIPNNNSQDEYCVFGRYGENIIMGTVIRGSDEFADG